MSTTKLDIKAFGLASGILWSASVFVMGILAMFCPWAGNFVTGFGTFYVGYSAGIVGSIIGAVWAFFDFAIFFTLYAWLYNKLAK